MPITPQSDAAHVAAANPAPAPGIWAKLQPFVIGGLAGMTATTVVVSSVANSVGALLIPPGT